jgi:methionine-rich copper-binding protein CopC
VVVSSPRGLRVIGRLAWLLAVLVLLAAGQPRATAKAHALLDHADPPIDSEVREPPSQLTLFFAQGLVPASSWIVIRDANDQDLPVQLEFDPADRKVMRAKLDMLRPGAYIVKWQTLSADDDDYAQGSYKLTVLNTDGSRPGLSDPASKSPSGGGIGVAAVILALGAGVLVLGGAAFLRLRRKPA